MSDEKRYKVTFRGREKGALGITYRIQSETSQHPDDVGEDAARLELYDRYEDVMSPKWAPKK